MKMIGRLILVIASSILVACTATTPTSATDSEETTENAAKPSVIANPAPEVSQAAQSTNQIASPDSISRLQSQVTALQEQLIKVTSDTAAILKMSQVLIANSQVQTASASNNSTKTHQPSATANTRESLNEVLKKLEAIAPSPEGSFGIVSSYTARKQWVLIRFDRHTGETWLADSNGWNTLTETTDLNISQYDIHLIRADQDTKGYVASRIDRRTGETWWLNKKQWVIYE
jgi:hypothetical protein